MSAAGAPIAEVRGVISHAIRTTAAEIGTGVRHFARAQVRGVTRSRVKPARILEPVLAPHRRAGALVWYTSRWPGLPALIADLAACEETWGARESILLWLLANTGHPALEPLLARHPTTRAAHETWQDRRRSWPQHPSP